MFRAGLIGCGRIGCGFDDDSKKKVIFTHASAYTRFKKTNLIALADIDSKKLLKYGEKFSVRNLYRNYKEMLSKEKIDILSICTPTKTHWPIVQYASKFPIRAIYCEKPISDNLKDAKKMIKLCQERKILLMVNHQRRFDPFYRELKQKIADGKIGRVQQANCYYTRGILNTGTHILDLFDFFFGQIEWTKAVYSKNKSPFEDDPNLDGVIKFKNGPLVTIKACDDSYYLILEIDILGSKARIRLGKEFEYFQIASGKNLLEKNELIRVKIPPFKSKYSPTSSIHGVEHIINCLEGKEKPVSSGDEAIKALETIKTMCLSAKNE